MLLIIGSSNGRETPEALRRRRVFVVQVLAINQTTKGAFTGDFGRNYQGTNFPSSVYCSYKVAQEI